MTKNLSRRERKKQETRQRLIEAALRLFRERGYDATTVESITQAADTAKGTFFNYFETKEAILPALAESQLHQLKRALAPELDAPASPLARIKLALRLVAGHPLSDPVLVRRLFATTAHRKDAHPAHTLDRLLADQVKQAQAVGEIRADLDSAYLGHMIRALLFQQIMLWHSGYHPASLAEMLDTMVDLLVEGIGGPKGR